MSRHKSAGKRIVERLTTLDKAGSFDITYWKDAGPRARFAAAWSAIKEFYKIRGIDEPKLRLRRTVQNIKQARR